jgi:hypothetical protein
VAGYFGMRMVSDTGLKPIIGTVVLAMLAVNWWRVRGGSVEDKLPHQGWFAVLMGLVAGVTTMMANVAGPVMIVYLLVMRLRKTEFVGTSAWFFFIVNWIKVPFMANLQLMTWGSLKLNVLMLPFIAAGAFLGIYLLKRVPQRAFTVTVQVLAAAAALKLVFDGVRVMLA